MTLPRLLTDHWKLPAEALPAEALDAEVLAGFTPSSSLPSPAAVTGADRPDEQADALRFEKYVQPGAVHGESGASRSFVRRVYYALRPVLPVSVRRVLQWRALAGWQQIPFPRWPVDATVEEIGEAGMAALLGAAGSEALPFIWFWPHGHRGAVMMTHDVETARGRDFCRELADVDAVAAAPSSFEVVPEKRYRVPDEFLAMLRDGGREVCVHGLDHDGDLFASRQRFMRDAPQIRDYAQRFGAQGFRSPVMYRNLDWLPELAFSYDMSVPNVAHLDPQRGGCCTVMPYFVEDMVELPLTATQDYTQFFILGGDPFPLWQEQARLVAEHHGLLSFIVHPDYLVGRPRHLDVYRGLLQWLKQREADLDLWWALPGQVADWWRARAAMQLRREDGRWVVRGPSAERACVAWASLNGDRLVFDLEDGRPAPMNQAPGTSLR